MEKKEKRKKKKERGVKNSRKTLSKLDGDDS